MENWKHCIAFDYELLILYTYNILAGYANGKASEFIFSANSQTVITAFPVSDVPITRFSVSGNLSGFLIPQDTCFSILREPDRHNMAIVY